MVGYSAFYTGNVYYNKWYTNILYHQPWGWWCHDHNDSKYDSSVMLIYSFVEWLSSLESTNLESDDDSCWSVFLPCSNVCTLTISHIAAVCYKVFIIWIKILRTNKRVFSVKPFIYVFCEVMQSSACCFLFTANSFCSFYQIAKYFLSHRKRMFWWRQSWIMTQLMRLNKIKNERNSLNGKTIFQHDVKSITQKTYLLLLPLVLP